MEDFAALLDSHACSPGCERWTHMQEVLVAPADVATIAAELAMLIEVRDLLAERGFIMREGDPTPRFDGPTDADPKPWAVRYESQVRVPRRRFGRR